MGHMSLDNGHHDSTKSPEWHSADSEAAMDAADRTERRRLQNRQAQRNHSKYYLKKALLILRTFSPPCLVESAEF